MMGISNGREMFVLEVSADERIKSLQLNFFVEVITCLNPQLSLGTKLAIVTALQQPQPQQQNNQNCSWVETK